MRFPDKLKLAGHSISKSKSRTVLTIIIAFVISLLIMGLVNLGISFSSNMNSMYSNYIQSESNISVNISSDYVENSRGTKLTDICDKYDKNVSTVSFASLYNTKEDKSTYLSNISLVDAKYSPSSTIEIKEGTNLSQKDRGQKSALISYDYVSTYYLTYGVLLTPGSEFNHFLNLDSGSTSLNVNIPLKVVGIFNNKTSTTSYNSPALIFDYHYVYNISELSSFAPYIGTILINIPSSHFNMKNFSSSVTGICNELTAIFPPKKSSGSSSTIACVRCDLLTQLNIYNIVSAAVIGVCGFLGFILLLISIGSLANSIVISVNNNKKFLGLSKALGLNESDLKGSVILEAAFSIIIGVGLASTVIVLLSPVFKNLVNQMLTGIFSMYMQNYVATYSLAWYVPLIVSLFFLLFAILFSRSSVRKIARMDPIEVINEVN